jgi:hypothetical protein
MSKVSEYLEKHGGKVGHEVNTLADVVAPKLHPLAAVVIHDAVTNIVAKHVPNFTPTKREAVIDELLHLLGLE